MKNNEEMIINKAIDKILELEIRIIKIEQMLGIRGIVMDEHIKTGSAIHSAVVMDSHYKRGWIPTRLVRLHE
jgi:hypothetical protein